ncbi:ABC transporter substrate-binding protein [Paenibacillus sp. HB172176]|uniref:ABC transporter substrate-binding protein n=1 Tax=Paenibacillus sp. HB172176 TaxID=2493690 RepID=UPI00143872C2|nr:ABC transporter substrate-binding protein [Paenibacillus sp. HB172176]
MKAKARMMSAVMIACLMMMLLAACGGNSNPVAGETTEQPSASAASAGTASDNEQDEVRTVQHALGTTEIPVHPERIVSINLEDMLLSLEVPLVLATPIQRQDYLNERLNQQGTTIASLSAELNFEAIIAAKPDLIIASDAFAGEDYEQLSSIAPTIAYSRSDWRTSIGQIAQALGMADKAEQVKAEQETFIADTKQEIAALIGEAPTTAFLRMQEKDLRLFFPSILSSEKGMSSYVSIAYEGLGWKIDPYIEKLQEESPDKQNASVSLEILPKLTADHLFVVTLSSDGSDENLQKTMEELLAMEDSSVWGAIPAVQKGNVYVLNMKNWLIEGPIAEKAKLAELLKVLQAHKQ